ncbi:MAG: biotin operon repressor [Treponema sp.]|nr:MAG: biotin operon repressor [Treponema sp.]
MTVKDSVFSVLQNSKTYDGFVSGQELAESCGVTRTSVWKAINALRSEGAQIEAVTNRGYRLVSNDVYNASEIQRHISDKSVNKIF